MNARWARATLRRARVFGVIAGFLLCASSALAKPPAATLRLGETRLFASGELRPGDKIACVGHGKRVTAAVPGSVVSSTSDGTRTLVVSWNSNWVRGLRLDISTRPHGSYVIACD